MLAQGIVFSSFLLAGSAFANQVQARYVTTEVAVTEVVAASYPVFTSVINATNVLNVTEGVATPTTYAEAFTSTCTMAPATNSTACFCSIAATANVTEIQALNVTETQVLNVTETQVLSVNGSTPTTIAVAAVATSHAIAATATVCPCQPVTTAQAVNQTTQPVGVPTTQSVGAETQGVDNNQVLNANSGVMEIISIQVAGIFTFIGLVGASVTFL